MVDAGKITGIISENTDIFVLPDQNEGDTTNPKEGFSCRSSKETYTCIIIFISTFQRHCARRWIAGSRDWSVNRFRFGYGVSAGRIRIGDETLPEFDIVFRRVWWKERTGYETMEAQRERDTNHRYRMGAWSKRLIFRKDQKHFRTMRRADFRAFSRTDRRGSGFRRKRWTGKTFIIDDRAIKRYNKRYMKRQEMHDISGRFFLGELYKDRRFTCGNGGYEKQYWKKWKKMKKVVDKQKERWYYKPRCWGNALKQRLSRRSLKRLPVRQQKEK